MEQNDVIEVYQEQTGGGADEAETEYIKLKVLFDLITVNIEIYYSEQNGP